MRRLSPQQLGQIPKVYNLDTDPKEMYNLFGRSGGIAPFEAMVRDVMTPYMISVGKFPHSDYANMGRDSWQSPTIETPERLSKT